MNRDSCFLCQSTENITRDHIPPKSFFTPPAPCNLITVPCCEKCNSGFSKDDEAFRLWCTTSAFASDQGKWVFENGVLGSTLKRSPKLRQAIREYIGSRRIQSPRGEIEVPTFGIPENRAKNFIIRVCKGLLAYFHPEYSYRDADFVIQNVLPTDKVNEVIGGLVKHLIYEERGDTVFKFWRGFTNDNPDLGMFVLTFFDGVCIVVFFGHGLNLEVDPDHESGATVPPLADDRPAGQGAK